MLVGVALEDGIQQIEVAQEELIYFPRGIVGFEECSRYALLQMEHGLCLLQAATDPYVGFVLIDPARLDPGYPRRFPEEERGLLDLGGSNHPALLCITTVSPEGVPEFVNLRAPIAINPVARLGTQVILQDGDYPVRYPAALLPDGRIAGGASGGSAARRNGGAPESGVAPC